MTNGIEHGGCKSGGGSSQCIGQVPNIERRKILLQHGLVRNSVKHGTEEYNSTASNTVPEDSAPVPEKKREGMMHFQCPNCEWSLSHEGLKNFHFRQHIDAHLRVHGTTLRQVNEDAGRKRWVPQNDAVAAHARGVRYGEIWNEKKPAYGCHVVKAPLGGGRPSTSKKTFVGDGKLPVYHLPGLKCENCGAVGRSLNDFAHRICGVHKSKTKIHDIMSPFFHKRIALAEAFRASTMQRLEEQAHYKLVRRQKALAWKHTIVRSC